MAGIGKTLPQLLVAMPCLMHMCLHGWDRYAVQTLRRVSKELNVATMAAVKTCSVRLGVGALPTPRHLMRMMQPAKLHKLTVTITAISGGPGPTPEEQGTICILQLMKLVLGMRTAILGVKHLTLVFEHQQLGVENFWANVNSFGSSSLDGPPLAPGFPASFAVVTRTICSTLAEGLPGLCHLTLQGCCSNPQFATFGANCPNLTSLRVEAISLPLSKLEGITTNLPKLEHFQLTDPELHPGGLKLEEYVEASLTALKPSVRLASISLMFDMNVPLNCKPQTWLTLPPSLHKFTCTCTFPDLHKAPALLSNLRSLSIRDTPLFYEVLQILKLAPHLRMFATNNESFVAWCGHETTLPGILVLRERIRNGLVMHFLAVHLVGTPAELAAALTAMPSAMFVTPACLIQFVGDPTPNCLVGVARVFPSLRELHLLAADPPEPVTAVIGTQMRDALAACSSLKLLRICLPMKHTISSLLHLCLGMPALKELKFINNARVNLTGLRKAITAKGRDVDIVKI